MTAEPVPSPPQVIVGTASTSLAEPLAAALGRPLTARAVARFPDGELHVELRDPVRGEAVFLVQTTGAPVGESLVELLLLADASRRAGAARVIAVVPYVGYARQDRRAGEAEALGIRVIAGILAQGGFDRIVVVDLHAPATEGCFAVPVEHVSAISLLAAVVRDELPPQPVVVAPDLGAVRMARAYAQRLQAPVAIVHKQRVGGAIAVEEVIGDVDGRAPIVVDDIVATGRTIAAALAAVRARGATGPAAVVATHLVPGAGAADALAALRLARVITTDSLPHAEAWPVDVRRVSLAPLLADVIGRLHHGASIGDLMIAR